MSLPKNILISAQENKTSIGDNPCLPPEEEEKFVVRILSKYFDDISSHFNTIDENELKDKLSSLVAKCKKFERNNVSELERICAVCVNELFDIPENTLEIKCKIVDSIDDNEERLLPEKTEDFSFDDINDMDNLTGEIYKRRMLNSLIAGASLYYAKNFKPYFEKVFDIESELPSLYKKIMSINDVLLFLTKDNLEDNCDGGTVNVYISNEDGIVTIESKALIFPILLAETIKGVLELSISHGLPNKREKAMYVIGKSDFKLAELWDIRIGCPLWELIVKECDSIGYDIKEIGINFILMYFAMMPVKDFNTNMKEIFACTKKGKHILNDIINDIERNKEQDSFNDYIQAQNSNCVIIGDDEYFEADDLITDSIF